MKRKRAKISKARFIEALGDVLLTQKEFSEKIGYSEAWVSYVVSSNSRHTCGMGFIRKVLAEFDHKYEFKDLFYWAK